MRGKSSLLNAILGQELLPTGVNPSTAIPTFVRGADVPRLRIDFEGANEPVVSLDPPQIPSLLSRYISEEENPRNETRVSLYRRVLGEFAAHLQPDSANGGRF